MKQGVKKIVARVTKTSSIASIGLALLGLAITFSAQANDSDRLTALTFKYTGNTCSAWSNVQGLQASCVNYNPGSADVRIRAFDPLSVVDTWYDGEVELGKEFTVDALNAASFFLTGSSLVVQISNLQGQLLQEVDIRIDDPLLLEKDDLYGGLILKKANYKFKIPKDYAANLYIVGFDDMVNWDMIDDYADYWKSYGVEAGMELPLVNALVMKVPTYITPDDLAADPAVTSVRLNRIMSAGAPLNAQGQSFIRGYKGKHNDGKLEEYEYPWSIAKLFGQAYNYDSSEAPTIILGEDMMPDVVTLAMYAIDKADLTIAVFDTGIEDEHERAGKVDDGIDVVTPDDNGFFEEGKPGDDNGHGTHVGGILTAMLDKSFKLGKDAHVKVHAVKILDQYAIGNISSIIMGLQWSIDNDVDIVNMSLGYQSDYPLVRKALQKAVEAGIILVASVGNRSNYDNSVVLQGMAEGGAGEGGAGEGGAGEGGAGEGIAGEGCVSALGEGGTGDGSCNSLPLYSVMYPARYPEVIAVGASDRWGEMVAFSNWGPEMDVLAPGLDIFSWDITNGNLKKGYGITNGTSMATPHVTAAVAMLKSLDPTLSGAEIRQILKQTADYAPGAPAGDLNLIAALSEVVFRLIGSDPSIYDYNMLKELYKDALKAKLDNL